MGLKILFCSTSFKTGPEALRQLLPEDDIINCPAEDAKTLGLDVDVLVPLMHPLERELISGTRARLIQQFGVGLEGVDIPLATSRGIMVCNVPADVTLNAESTAEHVVLLMLGVAKKIRECMAAFEDGVWGGPLGEALYGQTALVVGLGRVGKAIVRKLNGLGMQVHAIRRSPDPVTERELGIQGAGAPEDLFTMAAEADYVISGLPLTEETRSMFDRRLFESMKPTAFVINASRGPIVVENDLIEALHAGKIAGAGLDVFAQEPLPPAHPLLSLRNVFATPHVGGVTRQNAEGTTQVVADNIRRLKNGDMPLYCVNPETA